MNEFYRIKAEDCTALEHYGETIKINHPDFPRPRIFRKSVKGNWCWSKYADHGGYGGKDIWIVEGDLAELAKQQGVLKQ